METTPLLPHPGQQPPPDSHPIYQRACHSAWPHLDQRFLAVIRLAFAGYLSAVFGVSLKYKLDLEDDSSRIPFELSTVSLVLLWGYQSLATLWTLMHLFVPNPPRNRPQECEDHRLRHGIIRFLSPPTDASNDFRRFAFSMYYTTAHVFTLANTLIYWAILVPSGHGGFKTPNFPHNHVPGEGASAFASYDPDKGLFEEDDIKAFSVINVWSITSVIALIEIFFLNSIRRPTPVWGHIVGTMTAACFYLAWSGLGKLWTGHAGLFFLDPDLMGGQIEPVIASCLAFVAFAPGVFTYMYGLIAMRETWTAAARQSSN